MKLGEEEEEIQARRAQLVAFRLGTREVPGSNPGNGENFSVKIIKWSMPLMATVKTQIVREERERKLQG